MSVRGKIPTHLQPRDASRVQLRDYRIKAGELEDWTAEWSAHVRPLREKFGFQIVGAWAIPEEDRFIWILSHDDFEAADVRYYDSSDRRSIDPDPARHVATAVHLFMSAVGGRAPAK